MDLKVDYFNQGNKSAVSFSQGIDILGRNMKSDNITQPLVQIQTKNINFHVILEAGID